MSSWKYAQVTSFFASHCKPSLRTAVKKNVFNFAALLCHDVNFHPRHAIFLTPTMRRRLPCRCHPPSCRRLPRYFVSADAALAALVHHMHPAKSPCNKVLCWALFMKHNLKDLDSLFHKLLTF